MNSKGRSTVLVFLAPVLLLAVVGAVADNFALGLVDLVLLAVVWGVGLWLVWRPRHPAGQ